jgi:hypothetical protein
MDAIDPAICPLCGSTNMCAMEVAKATGGPLERCWCVDAVFTAELLESLPEEAKGNACVCAECSSKFKTLEK